MNTPFKTFRLIALAVLGLSALLPSAVSAQDSPLDSNKAVIRQFVDEAWNQGNFEHIDTLISPDSVVHHYLIGTLSGKEAVLGWIGYARSLVPDVHVTIERLVAQGDEVVMHWTSRGTYANAAGWPANQYTGSGLIIYALRDGLIVEQWYSADSLQEAQGSTPPTEPAAPDPNHTGDEQANLQLALGVHDMLWNDHDISTFDEVFAPTFVNADPSFPGVRNRDEFKQWAVGMWAAFPDLHTLVDGAVVDGATVVVRYTARGTHSGELAGLPAPDGALIAWTGTVTIRLSGGQVQAMWWSRDAWSVQQGGPLSSGADMTPPDTEASQAVVSQVLEWVNGRDLATLDALFAPTVSIHSAGAQPWTVDYYGLDGAAAYFGGTLVAFPDVRFEANDMVAEGDLVAVRWTMTGTFSGEYMGAAGAGQAVDVSGIDLWQVSGGQVIELWSSMDSLRLLQQMGLIPATP